MTSLDDALALVRTVPDFPSAGVLFRDLNPLFASAPAFRAVIDEMAAQLPADVTVIAAVEARGFLLGAALAVTTGLSLIPIRKPGKLPAVADRVDYALEYGKATLELPADVLPAGAQVAVVDDVLATGGTVDATCQLVERAGATVSVVSVVLELGALGGRDRLAGRKLHTLQTI
ncbi:adenine phosphoribosyltransferase [Actinophytocola oryzae]|uniref:Adenine phosphoribosyltransferase n=1 Tax=Actinophytocola oryzae TaxID=502181 RepID=A0A4R7VIJ3_9PSEU|nr:adenine phosphoribosyltransferase [Actinophytocola oryzae]TDV48918.1 adenine phosphoribosyltransferase [Actinophytocola oryzae]